MRSTAVTRFGPVDADSVQSAYREELDTLNAVLREVDELVANLNGRNTAGMTRLQYFALIHLVKAFKTCQAMRILFTNGYDEDGEILLRVFVEQAIRVRWVHKEDSDERVQAYAQYLWHLQHLELERVRKFLPGVDLSKYPIKQIEDGCKAYQKISKDRKWRHLGSIEQMAAKGQTDMEMSYELAYRRGSDFVHTNPTVERDYVHITDGKAQFNTVRCMPDNGLVPVMGAFHLLLIADVFNDVFNLGHSNQLQSLMARVQSAQPDGSE
jgi:hypothetical protein